jgi:hypothetical protein
VPGPAAPWLRSPPGPGSSDARREFGMLVLAGVADAVRVPGGRQRRMQCLRVKTSTLHPANPNTPAPTSEIFRGLLKE